MTCSVCPKDALFEVRRFARIGWEPLCQGHFTWLMKQHEGKESDLLSWKAAGLPEFRRIGTDEQFAKEENFSVRDENCARAREAKKKRWPVSQPEAVPVARVSVTVIRSKYFRKAYKPVQTELFAEVG
jgi:hypothetical protein